MLKIKELRKLRKVTQEQLAQACNLSTRAIIDYEKEDNYTIPVDKLKNIAHFLNFPICDFFENTPQDNVLKAAVLNEPSEKYGNDDKNLLEAKNETIAILKQQNAELRADKEFFVNLINSKLLK